MEGNIDIRFDSNIAGIKFLMPVEEIREHLGKPDNEFFNLNENRTLQFYKYSMSLIFEKFDVERLIKVDLCGDKINYNGYWLGKQRESDVKAYFEKLGYTTDCIEDLYCHRMLCYDGIWIEFKYDRFISLMISYYDFNKRNEVVFCFESDRVDFVPGESLGNVTFDMTKDDVDILLGVSNSVYVNDFGDTYHTYNNKKISIKFSPNGLVDEIITSSSAIYLYNDNLNKCCYDDVVKIFSSHNFFPQHCETLDDGTKMATYDKFILTFRFDKLSEIVCFK